MLKRLFIWLKMQFSYEKMSNITVNNTMRDDAWKEMGEQLVK